MKVTLKQVEKKAMKEPAFWRKLLADPDQTIVDNEMQLTNRDYQRLRAILDLNGRTIAVDLTAFIRARSRQPSDLLFWRGIWAEPGLPSYRGQPAPKIQKMPKRAKTTKMKR